ncbi:MAG: hypothetical protein Q9169_004481 [Polycauliona sp. 2 TL-2023]
MLAVDGRAEDTLLEDVVVLAVKVVKVEAVVLIAVGEVGLVVVAVEVVGLLEVLEVEITDAAELDVDEIDDDDGELDTVDETKFVDGKVELWLDDDSPADGLDVRDVDEPVEVVEFVSVLLEAVRLSEVLELDVARSVELEIDVLPEILELDVFELIELETDVLGDGMGVSLLEFCNVEDVCVSEEAVLLWPDEDDPLEVLGTGGLDEAVEIVPMDVEDTTDGLDEDGEAEVGDVVEVWVDEDVEGDELANEEVDEVSPFEVGEMIEFCEVEGVEDKEVDKEEVKLEEPPWVVGDWLFDVSVKLLDDMESDDEVFVDALGESKDMEELVSELRVESKGVDIVDNEVVSTVLVKVLVHVYADTHQQSFSYSQHLE